MRVARLFSQDASSMPPARLASGKPAGAKNSADPNSLNGLRSGGVDIVLSYPVLQVKQ